MIMILNFVISVIKKSKHLIIILLEKIKTEFNYIGIENVNQLEE